jgi:outer membrane biosynthesis protein TonB
VLGSSQHGWTQSLFVLVGAAVGWGVFSLVGGRQGEAALAESPQPSPPTDASKAVAEESKPEAEEAEEPKPEAEEAEEPKPEAEAEESKPEGVEDDGGESSDEQAPAP